MERHRRFTPISGPVHAFRSDNLYHRVARVAPIIAERAIYFLRADGNHRAGKQPGAIDWGLRLHQSKCGQEAVFANRRNRHLHVARALW